MRWWEGRCRCEDILGREIAGLVGEKRKTRKERMRQEWTRRSDGLPSTFTKLYKYGEVFFCPVQDGFTSNGQMVILFEIKPINIYRKL